MRVELNGRQYKIIWEYAHFETPMPLEMPSGKLKFVRGSTTCYAMLDDDREDAKVPASGVAWCSIFDSFTKEKGRKESLTEMLRNWKLPKEDRRKVWETYHDR